MKTYKTWEVIKMITEDKNKKFEATYGTDKLLIYANDDGFFKMQMNNVACTHQLDGNLQIRGEWTLIKQPVSFMEAIKAFSQGKTIKCRVPFTLVDDLIVYKPSKGVLFTELFDNGGAAITQTEILEGKWYIEED
ncbi:hypothetical protein 10S11_66 [uncultured Caudovirales phage]|uniref:Uncharacterized protein n=1 Tax=uncultured Caudovirales phage TaxID=2100421 RepID=A0A2H4J7N9_9CAUD|nr:hypothetical protein 10S11_66 [uncultured Caudovirales phage]